MSLRTDTEAAVEAWLASASRLQQLLTYKALNASGLRIGVSLDREIDALSVAAMAAPEPRVTIPLYIDHTSDWRCVPWSLLP